MTRTIAALFDTVEAAEKAGLISRKPGVPRRIAVLLDQSALPELNRVHFGTVGSPLGWEFCCSHMMICIGTRLFQISVTS
ncbi:MAG TPA: hypothetical protein VGC74_08330 [Stenotrophomonas sp.]